MIMDCKHGSGGGAGSPEATDGTNAFSLPVERQASVTLTLQGGNNDSNEIR